MYFFFQYIFIFLHSSGRNQPANPSQAAPGIDREPFTSYIIQGFWMLQFVHILFTAFLHFYHILFIFPSYTDLCNQ